MKEITSDASLQHLLWTGGGRGQEQPKYIHSMVGLTDGEKGSYRAAC